MEYRQEIQPLAFFEALDTWTSVVGPENIVRAEEDLGPFNNNTFVADSEVLAVVYPQTTEEVSQCMKIANIYNIEVYAISRGKNYGLGSKLPPKGKCILMELSRMNKILELNEELAYVVLEPGVSFDQLHKFLEEKDSNLMMDSIGSTKNASIVGNLAERGHGMALYADRMNFVCNFEVVLPTGEILHTSFDNQAGHTHKWGIGPLLNGLFTQSNLGIITKLTLWLHPKSELFESFIFYVKDNKMLGKAMACIRDLKLQGVQMSLRIFNDLRMISFYQNYPWEMMKGETPLSDDVRHFLKEKYNIEGKWVGLGAIYPFSELHGQAERAYIKEKMAPYVSDLEFINQDSIVMAKLRGEEEELSKVQMLYSKSLLRGFVSDQALNMCYWRKKEVPVQKNIHRDNCGVLWFCPVVP
ncbi:MAG: FAD-binding oxidoreductase, partial [Aureispira sp.]|nr:FAD-binding oxidoreductase [Aureispira sp.]